MEVGSIILAGGKASRLGRNKANELVGGKYLIERVIEKLRQLSSHIVIATSAELAMLFQTYDVEIAEDVYPDCGPLGGIYTGLMASPCLHNIVVACDMPFLNTELLRYMVQLSYDFDAVVPRLNNGYVEPLHSVYSRVCAGSIKARLDKGILQTFLFLSEVSVRYLDQPEYQKFDPRLLSFSNINDQVDVKLATDLLKEQE